MPAPRVSIAIPAYRERHFAAALASALAQGFTDIEVVVCDDSPGDAIEAMVLRARDPRVRYVRNHARLGFEGNFGECVRQSRGELVKLLNDDDRLRPGCVAGLLAGFDFDGRVTLATSRRAAIDEEGRERHDVDAVRPVSLVTCVVPGTEMGDFCLVNSLNVIGEPTTAMFRRRDVDPEGGGLFTWNGERFHVLADLSLWLRLLARGHCFYHAMALSEFRVHAAQEQRGADMDVAAIVERAALVRQARAAGFLRSARLHEAALAQVAARADAWLARLDLEPAHAARLRALKVALAAERPVA